MGARSLFQAVAALAMVRAREATPCFPPPLHHELDTAGLPSAQHEVSAASCPAAAKFINNTDFASGGKALKCYQPVPTIQQCCTLCGADSECATFVYRETRPT